MAKRTNEQTLLRVERQVVRKQDPYFDTLYSICSAPNHTRRSGQAVFRLARYDCVIDGDVLRFPDYFKGFTIRVNFTALPDFVGFSSLCMFPCRRSIVIEMMYCIAKPSRLPDNGRYLQVGIGSNDLATVFSNTQLPPFIINGRDLNEVNVQYNRKFNHYQEICKKVNHRDHSARLERMTMKRNGVIEDYMHKTSRYIVNCCLDNSINTIIIGNNVECGQGAARNENVSLQFEPIPKARLIEMLQYKADQKGISVIMADDVGDRSDISLFTEVFADVKEGAGLHPVVIDVA